MGALYGILKFTDKIIKTEELQELSKNIFRQPFDKDNFLIDKNVGIGNKLFCTTSESFSEKLPAYNQSKTILYSVDARIDNRDYLIRKLDICSIKNFDNKEVITDSNLILWAYEKWGENCVDYLIGDFAFVIWDKNAEKLVCGRDRLGVRPFFYYNLNSTFVFASEVYALTNSLNFYKEPNLQAVKSHLYHFGLRDYSETMYKYIYSLAPGSIMTIQNKRLKIRRYWHPENIKINHSLKLSNVKHEFLSLLKEAVECRLRSAFPIGFELSGGLDSSSVVCLADKIKTEQKKLSFSCVYENYHCDEKDFIDIVNSQTKIKNFIFKANKIDYKNRFDIKFNYKMSPEWPIYLPTTDSFPFTDMMQKHGVRVVLTGEGGDQVTQGSEYQLIDYLMHFNWLQFYRELRNNQFAKGYIKRFLIAPMLSKNMKNLLKKLYFKQDAKQKKLNISEIKDIFHFGDFKYKAFYEDLISVSGTLHSSWSDHNVYHSRGIYGLEFRHPFLDSRLIEFALTVPAKYKLNNNISKIMLREAMKEILPEKIRTRNDKAEFSEIIRDQLRAMDFSVFEKDFEIARLGLITNDEVQKYIKLFDTMGDEINPPIILKLWRIVNLEYWYKMNFPYYPSSEASKE